METKCPSVAGVQAVCPVLAAKVPGEHCVATDWPARPTNEPRGADWQTVAEAAPVTALKVPAAHGVATDAPAKLTKVPAGAERQAVCPWEGW